MNVVKKEIRDNKEEKDFRRSQITCHYDALAENFVARRVTNEGMLPKLKPTEVVGIIFLLVIKVPLLKTLFFLTHFLI